MSTGRRWQDIKAEAHRRNPELAAPERQAQARAELDAYVAATTSRSFARPSARHKPRSPRSWGSPSPASPRSKTATSKPWSWKRSAPTPPHSEDTWTSPSASAPTQSRSPDNAKR